MDQSHTFRVEVHRYEYQHTLHADGKGDCPAVGIKIQYWIDAHAAYKVGLAVSAKRPEGESLKIPAGVVES